jgi:hypothetical protein
MAAASCEHAIEEGMSFVPSNRDGFPAHGHVGNANARRRANRGQLSFGHCALGHHMARDEAMAPDETLRV